MVSRDTALAARRHGYDCRTARRLRALSLPPAASGALRMNAALRPLAAGEAAHSACDSNIRCESPRLLIIKDLISRGPLNATA
jgi:hypothetical protein